MAPVTLIPPPHLVQPHRLLELLGHYLTDVADHEALYLL